jgi:hypothetical protein
VGRRVRTPNAREKSDVYKPQLTRRMIESKMSLSPSVNPVLLRLARHYFESPKATPILSDLKALMRQAPYRTKGAEINCWAVRVFGVILCHRPGLTVSEVETQIRASLDWLLVEEIRRQWQFDHGFVFFGLICGARVTDLE